MDQPCDICGDIGFAQAIVTCFNCHKSREHIYCMQPNLCSVPESWRCESCLCHVHHHDNCHSESSTHCGQEVDLSRWENACTMGNESSKLPDVTKMGDSRKQEGSYSCNILPTPSTASTAHPESLTDGRVRSCSPEKLNQKRSQPVHDCKSSLIFPGESLTTENLESVEAITTNGKLHISDEARNSPLNYSRPLVCGVKVKSQSKRIMLGVNKQPGKMGSLLSMDCVHKEKPADAVLCFREDDTLYSKDSFKLGDETHRNPPAVDALWKGSFAILDFYDELYDGVEAYPPRKLSLKACLVSKEMPSMLQFELKPRLHVWPKIFEGDSPSEYDIALYFWADDRCRSTENYDHLMAWMVEKDLSMVSHLNGTELLIFTSSQLPVESQRLNKQFFLWGVFVAMEEQHAYADFRGKQEDNSPLLNCQIGEDPVTSNDNGDQIMDMEIDSEGTKEVGSVDICSRRNSNVVCPKNPDILSQDAFTRVHSDRPRYLHQTKREPYDDFDVPPGFRRPVSFEAQEPSVDFKLKQHLSDAPVLADKGLISTSVLIVSPVQRKEDASPGISDSTKLAKGDFSAKRFNQHQQELLIQRDPIQKQQVMMPIQQQRSMYQSSPSSSPKVDERPSEDLPPGFEQPCRLESPQMKAVQTRNLSPGFCQREPIQNGNVPPGFKRPGLLQSPQVKAIQSRNLSPGFHQIEPIRSGNMPPGFNQLILLQSPQMKASQTRNLSLGFHQLEPIRCGNVPLGFNQPSVFPLHNREMISSGNPYPGFDTSIFRSVYVSNIPPQVKVPLFQEIFKVAGAIEGCKLIREGESLCGFVDYYDHQSAEHAISTLNGRQLFGQLLKVSWPIETSPRGPFKIFVGDLCPYVTDASLFAFFSVFPSCLAARVMRDQIHGWSKLYGFVSFGKQQEAQDAIHHFSGKWLGTRQIRCNWATKGAELWSMNDHLSCKSERNIVVKMM